MTFALSVSFVGAAAYGLVQYVFHLKSVAWLLFLLAGCLAVATRPGRPRGLKTTAGALVAAALVLVLVRAVADDRPSYGGNRSFGFHEAETDVSGTYRWTEESAVRSIPWEGENLVLELANGHPLAAKRPVTVRIAVNGTTRAVVEISGGWERHRIHVGPPRKARLLLELHATPTFRPFNDFRRYPELETSLDIRSLGVAVREPVWE